MYEGRSRLGVCRLRESMMLVACIEMLEDEARRRKLIDKALEKN